MLFRKIIALLFIVAFATHTFNRVVIVFGFYANQEVIAATLCENKDKPVMKCEGKCQLSKKLKLQEKKEQQNPTQKVGNKPQDISSRSFFTSLAITTLSNAEQWQKSRGPGKPVHRSFAVFHPPITPVHFA